VIVGLVVCVLIFPTTTQAVRVISDHAFPRIANVFLKWELTEAEVRSLSQWDVVILDMEIQQRQSALLRQMRVWNPHIVLLAYITPQEIRQDAGTASSVLRRQLSVGIPNAWYLTNANGNRLSRWPGTWLLNISNQAPRVNGQQLNTYVANFAVETILKTRLWDGIFYDNAWDNITYFAGNDVDLNHDGVIDIHPDTAWRDGMKYLYDETRRLTSDRYIIVGNNNTTAYTGQVNGMFLENMQSFDWLQMMTAYQTIVRSRQQLPNLTVLNRTSNNLGDGTGYKNMRYGLTSALLENGYYSYDFGDQNHAQVWMYDEYALDLGKPINNALSASGATSYTPDVWRRDFENGLSVVNSTGRAETVSLGGEFEKIHGTQDTSINDGSIVSHVRVDAHDGVVLLKTFSTLDDVLFPNGGFVRFLHPDGESVRNGFFVFEDNYKGGDQIAHIDMDGNGKKDLVVVSGNKVMAWRYDGQPLLKLYPYTVQYHGSLNVAIGDLNHDRRMEVYVAPEAGYPLPIRVFTRDGIKMQHDWYPLGTAYQGGYRLAIGHVERGSDNQLVLGSGVGVDPIVFVYDQSFKLARQWLGFEKKFKGGIDVATGDLDGDGIDEVIVGAGHGKKPEIRLFDGSGASIYEPFVAYTSFDTSGVDVESMDVDFDGKEDIVAISRGF